MASSSSAQLRLMSDLKSIINEPPEVFSFLKICFFFILFYFLNLWLCLEFDLNFVTILGFRVAAPVLCPKIICLFGALPYLAPMRPHGKVDPSEFYVLFFFFFWLIWLIGWVRKWKIQGVFSVWDWHSEIIIPKSLHEYDSPPKYFILMVSVVNSVFGYSFLFYYLFIYLIWISCHSIFIA